MQRPSPSILAQMGLLLSTAVLAVGCGGSHNNAASTPTCASLVGMTIPASEIGIPFTGETKGATVTAATLIPASSATAGVEYCKVDGVITPGSDSEVVLDLVDAATYTVITTPDIKFRVALPTSWNNKTLQVGGGGFDGSIPGVDTATDTTAGVVSPLARGYVVLGSDSGHVSSDSTQLWNTESLKNFGREQIKKTHDTAAAIVKAYYGKNATYNYFQGGSQGGHEALIAARFYPYDFDGVVAGFPAYDLEAMHTGAIDYGKTLYNARAGGGTNGYTYAASAGEGWLSRPLQKLVSQSVVTACDALDGVTDGIVGDPGNATCVAYRNSLYAHTTANPLRCANGVHTVAYTTGGGDNDTCLSDIQIETLAHITSRYNLNTVSGGITLEGGLKSYGKWPMLDGMYFGEGATVANDANNIHDPSQEDFGSGYNTFDAFQASFPTKDQLNVLTRHAWTSAQAAASFDITQYKERVEELSTMLDTNSVDYAEFAGRGGKILHYHGAADVSITPYNSIDLFLRMSGQFANIAATSTTAAVDYGYWGTNPFWGTSDATTNAGVSQRSGVTITNGVVDNFYTFYLIPGYGHGHGYFKASVDWLSALENWREKSAAPGDAMVAFDENATTGHTNLGTRPVCHFPFYPKYNTGATDPTKAANYTCTKLTAYTNMAN